MPNAAGHQPRALPGGFGGSSQGRRSQLLPDQPSGLDQRLGGLRTGFLGLSSNWSGSTEISSFVTLSHYLAEGLRSIEGWRTSSVGSVSLKQWRSPPFVRTVRGESRTHHRIPINLKFEELTMQTAHRRRGRLLPELQQILRVFVSLIAVLTGAVTLWKQMH